MGLGLDARQCGQQHTHARRQYSGLKKTSPWCSLLPYIHWVNHNGKAGLVPQQHANIAYSLAIITVGCFRNRLMTSTSSLCFLRKCCAHQRHVICPDLVGELAAHVGPESHPDVVQGAEQGLHGAE